MSLELLGAQMPGTSELSVSASSGTDGADDEHDLWWWAERAAVLLALGGGAYKIASWAFAGRTLSSLLLGLGGTAAGAGGVIALTRAARTARDVKDAVGAGKGTFRAHLTGYWHTGEGASEAEKRMEGGDKDRKGHPLYTLEQHLAGKAPWVSVSGDDAIFPYGTEISLSPWPGFYFRVVDTGGRFRGANKMYRVFGEEPLDIRVDSPATKIPHKNVVATLDSSNTRQVSTSKMRGQVVTGAGGSGALHLLGAHRD